MSASWVITADTPSVPNGSSRSRRVWSGTGADWSVMGESIQPLPGWHG